MKNGGGSGFQGVGDIKNSKGPLVVCPCIYTTVYWGSRVVGLCAGDGTRRYAQLYPVRVRAGEVDERAKGFEVKHVPFQ